MQAFPDLLPATQNDSGYQGLRCAAVDVKGTPADLTAPATGDNRLSCTGNRDPLNLLVVACNADRTPRDPFSMFPNTTVAGDDLWERSGRKGRIVWGERPGPAGTTFGSIAVVFTGAEREFCQFVVEGAASGQELMDRWWRDAPI
ncbi:hypothetical protein H0264_08290 [Nocardia huaxiensis]|uniref:Uncharacterized protein n=1 Tax=Nocardia huaxiensis TaxID=2755382 RepID=A0A7D6VD97_9NOCA|nr:hypothetical protein [Nocardia huaxiensis]QLY32253.1 hypothetical protein H0264_08290 [Nocardia huaxiensis]